MRIADQKLSSVMSFVGYKYARESGLDLSVSSDGFEPVEEEDDDEPLMSPYHSGYAVSLASESSSEPMY